MDKIKNLLKSDTPTGNESAESSSNTTSRLSGQGSHFPGKDETTTSAGSGGAIGQTSTYTTTHLSKGDPTSSVADPQSTDPVTYQRPEAGAASTAANLAYTKAEERKSQPGHENPYRADHLDPRVDGLSRDSVPETTSTARSGHDSSLGSTTATGVGSGLAGAGAVSALSSSRGHGDTTTSSAHTGGTETTNTVVPSSLTTTADPVDRSAEYQSSTEDKGLGTSTTTGTTEDPSQQGVVGRVLGAVGLGGYAGTLGLGGASAAESSAVTDSHQPSTTTGIETYNAPTRQGPPTTHHRKESIPTTAYPSATFDSPRAINAPLGGAASPVVHADQPSHTGRDVGAGVAAGGVAAGVAAVGAHEYSQRESANTTGTSGADTLAYRDANTLGSSSAGQPATSFSTFHDATTLSGDSTTTGVTSRATEHATTTGLAGAGVASTSTGYSSTPTQGGHSTATERSATTGLGGADVTPAPAGYTTTPAQGDHSIATDRSTTTGLGGTSTTAADVGREKDNTARDIALGTGAGVAATGAGAYGAHEYSKKEAEKAEAKQETSHHKELEKVEKKHEKEAQKEADREAEVAALKDRREKEREQALLQKQKEEAEEERKIREERQRLAGTAGVGAAAGATAAQGEKEKEKKPSIFKRIFKRRKNKDTGEEEEYSSDDDPSKGSSTRRRSLQSATSAKTQEERYDTIPSGQKELVGAYGARLAGHPEDHPYHDNTERQKSPLMESQIGSGGKTQEEKFDTIPSDQKERVGAYGARLAGHPEDHPYHDNTERRSSVTKERRRSSLVESQIGPDGKTQEEKFDTIPSDQKERVGAYGARLSGHPEDHPYHDNSERRVSSAAAPGGLGASSDGATTGTTTGTAFGTTGALQKDSITGLPYDPSKDPQAAARLDSVSHGEGMGTFDKKDAALAAAGTGAVGGATLGSTSHGGAHSGTTAPATLESTGTRSMQPTEAVTGTPATTTGYNKSTAPATLGSTGTTTMQPSSAVTGTPTPHSTETHGTSASTTTGTGEVVIPDFKMGEITDHRR